MKKILSILIVAIFLLGFAQQALAAVAFSTNTGQTGAANSATVNITVTGTNPVLVVQAAQHAGSSTAVSWNLGGTATFLKESSDGSNSIDTWCIAAPVAGAGTTTISFSNTASYNVDVELFTGADQTTPCPSGDAVASSSKTAITLTPANLGTNDVNAGGAADYQGDVNGNMSNNSIRTSVSGIDLATGYSTSTASVSQSFSSVNGSMMTAIRIQVPVAAASGATNANSVSMSSIIGKLIAQGAAILVKAAALLVKP